MRKEIRIKNKFTEELIKYVVKIIDYTEDSITFELKQ